MKNQERCGLPNFNTMAAPKERVALTLANPFTLHFWNVFGKSYVLALGGNHLVALQFSYARLGKSKM